MDEEIKVALAFAKKQKQNILYTRKKRRRAQQQQDEVQMLEQYQKPLHNSSHRTKKHNQYRAPIVSSIIDEKYRESNPKIIDDYIICGENDSSEADNSSEFNLLDIENPLNTNMPSDNHDVINRQNLSLVPVVTRLHYFTNVSTNEYCRNLARFLRDGNICKSHSNRLITLIKSVLPHPNYMPSSISELYTMMNVEDLFTRRKVCITCKLELSCNEILCQQCQSTDQKTIAIVFDVDLNKVLTLLLQRLSICIEEYKKKRLHNDDSEKMNDILFNKLYNQLANK